MTIDYNPHVLPDEEDFIWDKTETITAFTQTIEALRDKVANLSLYIGELHKEIDRLKSELANHNRNRI